MMLRPKEMIWGKRQKDFWNEIKPETLRTLLPRLVDCTICKEDPLLSGDVFTLTNICKE